MNADLYPRFVLVLAALALVLAGCAGSNRAPSLYLLDHSHTAAADPFAGPDAPVLVVEPVALSPVFDEDGIVYQTSPHRVVIANDNRWAAPLAGQLRDVSIAELSKALPHARVLRRAPRDAGAVFTLTPRVDAFMGHYDGQARIAGEWRVHDASGAPLLQRRFDQRIPLPRDGYDALVASLDQGWRTQIRQLGEALAPRLDRAAANAKPD